MRGTTRRLTHLFQSLLALAAAPACSDGPTEASSPEAIGLQSDGGTGDGATDPAMPVKTAGIPRQDFDQSACEGASYVALRGVTPAVPVDYLALLVTFKDEDGGAFSKGSPAGSSGDACKTASNVEGCKSALAALVPNDAWSTGAALDARIGDRYEYLVYTRGDEAAAVTSIPSLAAFLAPLDVHDAALLASAQGYRPSCDGMSARARGSDWEIIATTGSTCSDGSNGPLREHRLRVASDGTVTVLETVDPGVPQQLCGIGRRPEGLDAPCIAATTAIGAHLARIAHLEAASIPAFDRLIDELEAHRAPDDLVARAHSARADEVVHARMTHALAIHYGGETRAPTGFAVGRRSLFEMARDNAVEGCVGETYGAALATVQAARAEDPVLRRAFAKIAADETEHAALSWDIAEWAASRLSAAERDAIAREVALAIAELRAEVARTPNREVARALGLPSVDVARAMLDAIGGALSRDLALGLDPSSNERPAVATPA